MFKKFLSIVLAVSLMLSLAFAVNTAASTTSYAQLDLSSKNIGDAVTSHGGYGTSAIVVSEDNEKAVLIAKNLTEYDLNGTTKKLLNYVSAAGSDFLSASNPKGIVFESTMKITSSSDTIFLTTNASNTTPRYITLNGGAVKYNSTFGTSATATGVTYPVNSWFTIKLSWNMTTGYIEISVKDLSAGTENMKALNNTGWIKSASDLTAVKTFSWYLDGSSYVYIRALSVLVEDDATAIAPSHTLVRDDFDADTNALTGWSGSGAVATTDRGKSAMIDCSAAKAVNQAIKLGSDAKGLVSEFSVKLTSKTAGNFFYTCNSAYWTANYRLIQFTNSGAIHAFNGEMPLGTYETNVWYDIRIENNFVNDFTRVSIFDGTDERVYEAIRTNTSWDTISNINNVYFYTEQAADKSIYIDDVNVYYLTESEVSGLKNPRTYSFHKEFENLPEGDMTQDIVADVTCAAPNKPKSFFTTPEEDVFEVGIESIPNSGRGKSFKASLLSDVSGKNFYQDFPAIQNGVAEFDMLLNEQSGETVIEAQMAYAENGEHAYATPFRFMADGKIYDVTGADVKGNWEAGKWYHVVLTAGTYNIDGNDVGGLKAVIYGEDGSVAAETTLNSSADLNNRDSIRNVRIAMANGVNTIYVDNFKVYVNTEAQGLFPTPSYLLRNKSVAPDGALTLAFSKLVDLAKSKFKVNGAEVTGTLLGGNVVKLNKTITSGETYEIEYTAADKDGYTTNGYIGNITVPAALVINNYVEASMSNPTASVDVAINSSNVAKSVKLFVAVYNADETRLLSIGVDTAYSGTGTRTLQATADTTVDGAAVIKTFLWDGISLTPIQQ